MSKSKKKALDAMRSLMKEDEDEKKVVPPKVEKKPEPPKVEKVKPSKPERKKLDSSKVSKRRQKSISVSQEFYDELIELQNKYHGLSFAKLLKLLYNSHIEIEKAKSEKL